MTHTRSLLLSLASISAAIGALAELASGHSLAGGVWLCAAALFAILQEVRK